MGETSVAGHRASTLAACLAAAPDYHMKEAEAAALIEHQVTTISENWQSICDEAELSQVDRKLLAGRQFLNGYALDGLNGHNALRCGYSNAQDTLTSSGDT